MADFGPSGPFYADSSAFGSALWLGGDRADQRAERQRQQQVVAPKVYVYTRGANGGSKTQEIEAPGSDDDFGRPLLLRGDKLWLGARTGPLTRVLLYARSGGAFAPADEIPFPNATDRAFDVQEGTLAAGFGYGSGIGVRVYTNSAFDVADAGTYGDDAAIAAADASTSVAPEGTSADASGEAGGAFDAGVASDGKTADDTQRDAGPHTSSQASSGCGLAGGSERADESLGLLALAWLAGRRKRFKLLICSEQAHEELGEVK